MQSVSPLYDEEPYAVCLQFGNLTDPSDRGNTRSRKKTPKILHGCPTIPTVMSCTLANRDFKDNCRDSYDDWNEIIVRDVAMETKVTKKQLEHYGRTECLTVFVGQRK